jgi:hypothetical protein
MNVLDEDAKRTTIKVTKSRTNMSTTSTPELEMQEVREEAVDMQKHEPAPAMIPVVEREKYP